MPTPLQKRRLPKALRFHLCSLLADIVHVDIPLRSYTVGNALHSNLAAGRFSLPIRFFSAFLFLVVIFATLILWAFTIQFFMSASLAAFFRADLATAIPPLLVLLGYWFPVSVTPVTVTYVRFELCLSCT